jgi:hypothetical protein
VYFNAVLRRSTKCFSDIANEIRLNDDNCAAIELILQKGHQKYPRWEDRRLAKASPISRFHDHTTYMECSRAPTTSDVIALWITPGPGYTEGDLVAIAVQPQLPICRPTAETCDSTRDDALRAFPKLTCRADQSAAMRLNLARHDWASLIPERQDRGMPMSTNETLATTGERRK